MQVPCQLFAGFHCWVAVNIHLVEGGEQGGGLLWHHSSRLRRIWYSIIIIIGCGCGYCQIIGEPFQFRYWLAQCAVYLLVMLVEKICVGPLILFNFWKKVCCI